MKQKQHPLSGLLSSLNYAICSVLDLKVHMDGWKEEDCAEYLKAFGISKAKQIWPFTYPAGRTRQLPQVLSWILGNLQTERECFRTLS